MCAYKEKQHLNYNLWSLSDKILHSCYEYCYIWKWILQNLLEWIQLSLFLKRAFSHIIWLLLIVSVFSDTAVLHVLSVFEGHISDLHWGPKNASPAYSIVLQQYSNWPREGATSFLLSTISWLPLIDFDRTRVNDTFRLVWPFWSAHTWTGSTGRSQQEREYLVLMEDHIIEWRKVRLL